MDYALNQQFEMLDPDYKDKVQFFVEGQLQRRRPFGLRVVATYNCNRACSFCYQKDRQSVDLDPLKLAWIMHCLRGQDFAPTYITYQGGEIGFCKDARKYFDCGQHFFPQTYRKGITTNGDQKIEWFESLRQHGITNFNFSLHDLTENGLIERKIKTLAQNGFYAVRVNCFVDLENLEAVERVINWCRKHNIQLTLCEDINQPSQWDTVEILADHMGWWYYGDGHKKPAFPQRERVEPIVVDQTKTTQHIIRIPSDSFPLWIYKNVPLYDYNNIVVLPNGDLTMRYDDIKECKGDA